jgi:hypothetical protein
MGGEDTRRITNPMEYDTGAGRLKDAYTVKVQEAFKKKADLSGQSAFDKQVGGEHYKDKALQPWEIIEKLDLDFWEGNALKYLLRYKDKNGVEDLKKAVHYIEYLIEKENNNG